MTDRSLPRRLALRYGAAGLLGSVGVAGFARGQTDANRIVVSNRGHEVRTSYEFEVSGTVEALDSPAGDHTDGSRARGAVYDWRDGYRFSGEVVAFSHDGPVDVYVNGRAVDPETLGGGWTTHRVVIDGTGPRSTYEFSVSGEITGDEFLSETDIVSESTATGAVYGWKDVYTYTGELTAFSLDGPARVSVDGAAFDPETLDDGEAEESPWRRLVVSNRGFEADATYEFEASEAVEALDAPAGDDTDGSRAWGEVAGWEDGYRFRGDLVSFSHDGPVRLLVDGEETDPSAVGSDGGSGTVRTRGTPLHDMDDWSDWDPVSGATEVTADSSVTYRGATALRLDVADGRLGARYDPGSTLDLSGKRFSLALKWAAPARTVRVFLTLVDSAGRRSRFRVTAPNDMAGPDQAWARYSVGKGFDAPDDADLTDIAHVDLSTWPMESGRVWVDDIRLHDRLDRGRVAFTFDDGGASRRKAIDALNERGVPGTLFPIGHRADGWGNLTVSDLDEAKAAGWTVGSHPQYPDSLAAMSAAEAASAMDADRQWLRDHGFDPGILAWPYGAYDSDALAAADERYDLAFTTAGSPSAGEISTPVTAGRMNGNTPDHDGDGVPDAPKRAIDRAAEYGELVVFNYHAVAQWGEYAIPLDLLEGTVDYALDADVDIVTCADLVP